MRTIFPLSEELFDSQEGLCSMESVGLFVCWLVDWLVGWLVGWLVV